MMRNVFDALKNDSRKGDFIYLTNQDKIELVIYMEDHEIQLMSKMKWKKYVREQTIMAALKSLVYDNGSKKKTKNYHVFRFRNE